MKSFVMALLLSATLLLAGCALTDSLFLAPLVDPETGEEMYVDVEATNALPDVLKDDGEVVVVKSSDRVPGKEYELAYSGNESGTVKSAKGIAALFGPWGALGGSLLTLLGGVYAGARGKKKFKLKGEARERLTEDLVGLIEKAKERDEGLGGLIAELGGKVRDPEYLKEVVRILTGSFSDSERQKMLDKAAADSVKRNG